MESPEFNGVCGVLYAVLFYNTWSDSFISKMGVWSHLDKWFMKWTLHFLVCVNLTIPADEKKCDVALDNNFGVVNDLNSAVF